MYSDHVTSQLTNHVAPLLAVWILTVFYWVEINPRNSLVIADFVYLKNVYFISIVDNYI